MDSKLSDLIEASLDRTEAGKLVWESFDSESFHAQIGSSGGLHIQRGSTQVTIGVEDSQLHRVTTYSVQVSDHEGRVVTDAEVVEGDAAFRSCHNLFLAARKNALQSDRVLSDMLESLGGAKKVS